MAELMELLEQRRQGRSDEKFGVELGLSGSTIYRYRTNKAEVGMDAIHKMIPVFVEDEDAEMLGAFVAYVLGIKNATPDDLVRLGQPILEMRSTPSQ